MLGRLTLTAVFSVVAVILGLWASYTTGNGSWLARSGAVIVILGAISVSRGLFRHESGLKYLLEQMFTRDGLSREKVGLILMIIGTLIWAFGDLVGHLLPASV